MPPGWSGSMSKVLVVGEIGVSERTADLTEDVDGRDGVRPNISILQQRREGLARVAMRDRAAERSPQPLDAVGLRVVRRRVDQHELTTELLQQLAQLERAPGGVDAQVVQQHQRDAATRLRALDGSAELGAEGDGSTTRCPLPIEPAIAPVDQPEAVLLGIVAGRLDQPLATT